MVTPSPGEHISRLADRLIAARHRRFVGREIEMASLGYSRMIWHGKCWTQIYAGVIPIVTGN